MLKVVVHEKGGRTQRFDFDTDQFTVGREDDNDLVLDRVNISKYHLRFRRHQGRVEVVDLGSTNGTYVNGRKVEQPRAVRRSDRIYVGDYILMLDGEDPAIAPLKRSEIVMAGHEGHPQSRAVAVPPPELEDGEALPVDETPTPLSRLIDDDSDLLTSARRVAPAGVESTYLDRIANRVLQTVLVNVSGLDPLRVPEVSEEDRETAMELVDGLLRDMARAGELEEGVNVEVLRDAIIRELVELGPLTELMKDEQIREIQVAGAAAIRTVRDRQGGGAEIELTSRRFSGDRAVVLAVHRMARRWGFLVEGSQVLEGKVDDGFSIYALLPPTQVRSPVLHLRRHRTDANNLTSLVQEGVLSPDMAELIAAAIRGCRRILISASGGTNLDRFMGALTGEIPDELRVACISDSGRLGAGRRGWLQVRRIAEPSDTLGLSDALGVILRGGLDLLVSQRCRHEDAAAVMDAFAGATRGAIVSLWGIDSAHALWRMAGLSTVAAGAIGALTVSLARSVDLLIRLNVGVNQEAMQVIELVEPRVKAGDQIVHVPLFQAERDADKNTTFKATGEVPSFIRELAEQGIAVPTRMFAQERL
ncbi:FHA domain-containing protein [Paraliomyxa miuraensis]|uniref:FHA domain-containing protein n=1 Tax=Paraliomyxa miuraensis TaxID=376150 RepID=UPI002256A829|nr:FHA domain-containing protein [Paraliomyxa miuraensis]MCX4244567.1 FHA domain-containing protein [Paraliomyxa miuraensis]